MGGGEEGKRWLKGDLKNCVYRWKNPGYAPACWVVLVLYMASANHSVHLISSLLHYLYITLYTFDTGE